VCRSLASQLSREADVVDKDLRTAAFRSGQGLFGPGFRVRDKAERPWRWHALRWRALDRRQDPNEQNPDRMQPQFTINMDDNYLPVAPVGNEGTPQPVDDTDV
jgi:hypothetical protein